MMVTTAMPDERCCSWSRVRGAARAPTRGPDSAIRTWCCEFAAAALLPSTVDRPDECAEDRVRLRGPRASTLDQGFRCDTVK